MLLCTSEVMVIPANLPKFLSIPKPICICSATLRLLSFPVQSFSVFTAFCSAALPP